MECFRNKGVIRLQCTYHLGPDDHPVDYRRGLTNEEFRRKHLDDGKPNLKGTHLYRYDRYEDAWKDDVYRTRDLLVTVMDVADDGSLNLRLDRQSGIVGRSGTVKSNYTYIWNPTTNTVTSPHPHDLYPCYIHHFFAFFKHRPTVLGSGDLPTPNRELNEETTVGSNDGVVGFLYQ